ncbi:hypothetical protein GCM10011506_38960 [Marivirga lumbricoides]|uniref:Uncharacterized protein n=1 Tax=Marivirga lumbricoides TaxID=1046115 RepID=A0ABQ1N275_9BACT|nr:hypothetical protein GCM10011506_38960 [Marivirga lumbricoides]
MPIANSELLFDKYKWAKKFMEMEDKDKKTISLINKYFLFWGCSNFNKIDRKSLQ